MARVQSFRILVAVVLAITLWHAGIAAKMALTVDEAHYALYGLHPALSYFDHPPLVGWIQALMLYLGSTELVMRMAALWLSLATVGMLYHLTKRWFGSSQAVVAVVLFYSTTAFHLLGIALLPETPLLLCVLVTVYLLDQAIVQSHARQWLLVGAVIGLACLSKYTGILLAVLALLWLVNTRVELFKTMAPWYGAMVACVLCLPIVLWNVDNDFLSWRYQLNHGHGGGQWQVLTFVKSLLAQGLFYGPWLSVGGVWVLWRYRPFAGASVESSLNLRRRQRLLWLAVVVLWLPVVVMGGFAMSLPHWAASAWLLMIPLVAHALVRSWPRTYAFRASWSGLALLSLALVALVLSELTRPWLVVLSPNSPRRDVEGWREAASQARQLADSRGIGQLWVSHWTQASRIAWYARPLPVAVLDQRLDQFDLWFGAPQQRGLWVEWVGSGTAPLARCQLLGHYDATYHGHTINQWRFYDCTR